MSNLPYYKKFWSIDLQLFATVGDFMAGDSFYSRSTYLKDLYIVGVYFNAFVAGSGSSGRYDFIEDRSRLFISSPPGDPGAVESSNILTSFDNDRSAFFAYDMSGISVYAGNCVPSYVVDFPPIIWMSGAQLKFYVESRFPYGGGAGLLTNSYCHYSILLHLVDKDVVRAGASHMQLNTDVRKPSIPTNVKFRKF